jgi:hypothetical protein
LPDNTCCDFYEILCQLEKNLLYIHIQTLQKCLVVFHICGCFIFFFILDSQNMDVIIEISEEKQDKHLCKLNSLGTAQHLRRELY